MTNIINVDLEKIIESSISELTKKLSSELNKKVREDVINNLMMNITTKSIYGLDDIKDFGKIDVGDCIYESSTNKYYNNNGSIHTKQPYLELKKNEYPILYYSFSYSDIRRTYYITNIIDDLILDNDDIMFLSLFLSGIKVYYNSGYNCINPCGFKFSHGSSITTKFIQENKLMGNTIEDGCHAILHDDLLKKSLKRYFASVHDNKIKAFEFDKLIENNKKLEVSINNILENNKKLDEKIIKLEEENYIYCKKILELEETIETKIELENNKKLEVSINNILENNKKLDEKIIKLEEENYIYCKKILELEETIETKIELENNKQKETIIELEDKNKNLEEEYKKLFTIFTETKDELNKTNKENNNLIEENNNLIEENKNVNLKIIELIENMKNMSNELNKTKEENIKLSDKWLILKDETIKKFEEDNYKLRMEKNKLIKKIAELEKKTE